MSEKFKKKIENFRCKNCGCEVFGNGYTNHCPVCLYSKHVDIHPGDRLSECKGLMMPIDFETKDGTYVVTHCCLVCNIEKKNKTAPNDNFGILLQLSKEK